MPEYPEVEITRQHLETLIGATIVSVECRCAKLEPVFEAVNLYGFGIRKATRHGKLLAIHLDRPASSDRFVLALHLRMSGRTCCIPPMQEPSSWRFRMVCEQHARAASMYFCDPRRLGTVWLGSQRDFLALPFVVHLGPEVAQMNMAMLVERLGGSSKPLKALLLDQKRIAGVGNILADEALWEACIHPMRTSQTLTDADWIDLNAGLHRAIARSMPSDAQDSYIATKAFPDYMQCYGRVGQPCVRCSSPLAKIAVAGRGSTFCPRCQYL